MSMLKLADRDYAALRHFQGRSSIETFLSVVITRVCHDHLDKVRGKYRTSVIARRLGPIAVWMEMYMNRDHQTFEAACQTLRSKHGVTLSDHELEQLAQQLPVKFGRIFEGDAVLAGLPSTDGADVLIVNQERERLREQAKSIIDRTLAGWPDEDALLFRMRFSDGMTVANIAKMWGLDQRQLYRRFEEMLEKVRTALKDAGFTDLGDLD